MKTRVMNSALKISSTSAMTACLLASMLALGQSPQKTSPHAQSQTGATPQAVNTPGRIAKFTTNKALGDSNITEDGSGRIGIGTTLPTSTLTVNGIIEMMGGLKFPDGTLQRSEE